ncbi:shikimate kinase [candidate division KSB1 bacterium]|nr:MAG: shikimate kinase [candidate division KSB1 bacterium]
MPVSGKSGEKYRFNNVYLTGFMASGKTATGRIIADILSWKFIDTDAYIEESERMLISDIFDLYGEEVFRKMENNILKRISSFSECVVALGGGVFVSSENRNIIRNSGISVALLWPPEILVKRVGSGKNRPLLKGLNTDQIYKKVKKLLDYREEFYRMADVCLEFNTEIPVKTVAQRIINSLEKFR